MNEIERLKAWYKKRIEEWENTVCTLGFIGIILNLIAMVFFLVTKGAIGLLFLFSVIVHVIGVNFLTHEYEIEKNGENLKIFLKEVDERFKKATTLCYIKMAHRSYQTIPYDMLMEALEDHGLCVKASHWGPHVEIDYWRPFEEKDYECCQALYLIKRSD